MKSTVGWWTDLWSGLEEIHVDKTKENVIGFKNQGTALASLCILGRDVKVVEDKYLSMSICKRQTWNAKSTDTYKKGCNIFCCVQQGECWSCSASVLSTLFPSDLEGWFCQTGDI